MSSTAPKPRPGRKGRRPRCCGSSRLRWSGGRRWSRSHPPGREPRKRDRPAYRTRTRRQRDVRGRSSWAARRPAAPGGAVPAQAGVGPGHAALDVTGHRVVQGVGQTLPAAGHLARLPQAALQLEQGGPGAEKVQPQQDEGRRAGSIYPQNGAEGQWRVTSRGLRKKHTAGPAAPDQREYLRQMCPLKFQGSSGIVPPLLMGDAFQQQAGGQLQAGGQDHAAQEQKKGRSAAPAGKMAKRTAARP